MEKCYHSMCIILPAAPDQSHQNPVSRTLSILQLLGIHQWLPPHCQGSYPRQQLWQGIQLHLQSKFTECEHWILNRKTFISNDRTLSIQSMSTNLSCLFRGLSTGSISLLIPYSTHNGTLDHHLYPCTTRDGLTTGTRA